MGTTEERLQPVIMTRKRAAPQDPNPFSIGFHHYILGAFYRRERDKTPSKVPKKGAYGVMVPSKYG